MPSCIYYRYIQLQILHPRVATNKLLFKIKIKDSDKCIYCYTIPNTLCHASNDRMPKISLTK